MKGSSDRMPYGGLDLIAGVIKQAGFSLVRSIWVIYVIARFRGTGTTPAFKPLRVDLKMHGVVVKIKPGGNGTARECCIVPPRGVALESLLQALKTIRLQQEESPKRELKKPAPVKKAIRDVATQPEREPMKASEVVSADDPVHDPDTRDLALLEIWSLSDPDGWVSIEDAREVLRELVCTEANNQFLGQVFRRWGREGHIEAQRDGVRLVALRLSQSALARLDAKSTTEHDRQPPMLAAESVAVPDAPVDLARECLREQIAALQAQLAALHEEFEKRTAPIQEQMGKLHGALDALS